MRRIISATATVLTTLLSLQSWSNASNEFTSIFDLPPKPSPDTLPSTNNNNILSHIIHENSTDHPLPNRPHAPTTKDEKTAAQILRSNRMAERRTLARQKISESQHSPNMEQLVEVSEEELMEAKRKAVGGDPGLVKEENGWLRGLNWGSGGSEVSNPYGNAYADSGIEYEKWAQAYRMVGAFIDCDNDTSEGSGDGDGGGDGACSRWMMWAAYVNPNYQGNGYADYYLFDDDGSNIAPSQLDCQDSSSDWELLGVYRQEFYQFVEQISKHLWAITSEEYAISLSGLTYMTDADCTQVSYNGNYMYAAVKPVEGGEFQMGLYTDETCIDADTSGADAASYIAVDYEMNLGSKDDGTTDDGTLEDLYGYWVSAQEPTLEKLNEIYNPYRYCTLCMDYPTYQDGYFIGDTGTDDDDLINQCWKFYSHDSEVCESDCMAIANAQGSIVKITVDDDVYGEDWEGSSSSGRSYSGGNGGFRNTDEDNMQKFKANAFLVGNGILFVATFLAFSVARGARADSRRGDKGKSLLSRDERARSDKSKASRKSRRSRSRKSSGAGDDRTARSKSSRSKSGARKSRDASSSRKKSRDKSRSRRDDSKV